MEVTFGFLNICSFFPIWIFNIYSWIVSTALYGDDVLSVPATKAFSKSQAFYDFPCSFFAYFHAADAEATKAETLWLCLVFDPIPQVAVIRQVLPLLPNLHLQCSSPEGFPRTVGSLREGADFYFEWKRLDWEFYWSHAVKLHRGLNLIASNALGQYTWRNYS